MLGRIDQGLKKKESSRQLVQNDLAAMKEEIRQIQLGSGSTVFSEASTAVRKGARGTFVRPPPGIAVRLDDFFMPRKMEFKGWVTDYKRCCLERFTNNEVTSLISDWNHYGDGSVCSRLKQKFGDVRGLHLERR